jgi:hypothetical protein
MQAFALELGLDKRMLELELMANREAARDLAAGSLMMHVGDIQSDISGYHGIASRIPSDTISFADWMSTAPQPPDVKDMAEILLGELLSPFFRERLRYSVEFRKWLNLTPFEIAQATTVIDSFTPVLTDSRVGDRKNAAGEMRRLQAFLEGNVLSERPSPIPEHVIFVRSFGDLHSDNILVFMRIRPRPILINASQYSNNHWAADIATLIVDLFLRVRRPGVDSMIWDDTAESVKTGLRLCPLSHGEPDGSGSASELFISHAVMNLKNFTHSVELGVPDESWHSQWHLALAKEFLRQSSHHYLTSPRAGLALLLASAHLNVGQELLRRGGRSPH